MAASFSVFTIALFEILDSFSGGTIFEGETNEDAAQDDRENDRTCGIEELEVSSSGISMCVVADKELDVRR